MLSVESTQIARNSLRSWYSDHSRQQDILY